MWFFYKLDGNYPTYQAAMGKTSVSIINRRTQFNVCLLPGYRDFLIAIYVPIKFVCVVRHTSWGIFLQSERILNHFFVSRKIAQFNRQKCDCFVLNFFDIVFDAEMLGRMKQSLVFVSLLILVFAIQWVYKMCSF